MHKSKSSDFRAAIEEAFLAEHGFFDTSRGTVQLSRTKVNPVGVEEATGSNQDWNPSLRTRQVPPILSCYNFLVSFNLILESFLVCLYIYIYIYIYLFFDYFCERRNTNL